MNYQAQPILKNLSVSPQNKTPKTFVRGKSRKNISAFADSPGIRLQKYLSSIGFNSRRTVENLIQKDKIIVNGKLAKLGLRVRDGDLIRWLITFDVKLH